MNIEEIKYLTKVEISGIINMLRGRNKILSQKQLAQVAHLPNELRYIHDNVWVKTVWVERLLEIR